MKAITHCDLRQYVKDMEYREFNRIFGALTRNSDYIMVTSGYYDLDDACARLADVFIRAGVPAQYCEYDALVYQLAMFGKERLECDRG